MLATKRSNQFPRALRNYLIWTIVSLPLSLVLAVLALSTAYGVPVTFGTMIENVAREIGQWLAASVGALIWMAYLSRSRRVALTFTQ